VLPRAGSTGKGDQALLKNLPVFLDEFTWIESFTFFFMGFSFHSRVDFFTSD
jgi:hypothetical protein